MYNVKYIMMTLEPVDWEINCACSDRPTQINPLTPKISLLILSFIYDTFPCDLVMRSWFEIKIITSIWLIWVFSLPVCWIIFGYWGEVTCDNHFWELKVEGHVRLWNHLWDNVKFEFNLLNPKSQLLILPCSCYMFSWISVSRIWC